MEEVLIDGHPVSLYFDKDDNIYVAKDKSGYMTHGDTKEEAIEEMKVVL